MSLGLAVVGLLLPVVLGAVTGAAGLFTPVEDAIGHLNRFALYVAFPALVFAGLLVGEDALPTEPAFWALVPVALALGLVPVPWLGQRLGGHAGTIALVASFPNVAYLGLPVVEAVLGADALGHASLLVGVHLVLSLTVGPVLLLAWSDGPGAEITLWTSLRTVVRLPLFWATVLGVVGRAGLPQAVIDLLVGLVGPLGRAAGPVALFLLGLYLHAHADLVRRMDAVAWAHVGVKLVWVPLLTVGLVLAARAAGALDLTAAQVLVIQAVMPTGITTFAIAREYRIGEDRVAQAIVAGTLLSAFTVPVMIAWVVTLG